MADKKPDRPRLLLLFAAFSMLLMSACAGLFGLGAFLEIAKLSRVAQWPSVDGTIVAAAVVSGCQGPATFTPQVEYSYNVGGIHYQGKRRDMGAPACFTEDNAADLARRYPVGSRVAVHVDPQRPAEAVLETSVQTGALWFMGIAATIVSGTGLYWLLPRLRVLMRGRGNSGS
jgi:hypothetical protein